MVFASNAKVPAIRAHLLPNVQDASKDITLKTQYALLFVQITVIHAILKKVAKFALLAIINPIQDYVNHVPFLALDAHLNLIVLIVLKVLD